jgi:hypothetical protein
MKAKDIIKILSKLNPEALIELEIHWEGKVIKEENICIRAWLYNQSKIVISSSTTNTKQETKLVTLQTKKEEIYLDTNGNKLPF